MMLYSILRDLSETRAFLITLQAPESEERTALLAAFVEQSLSAFKAAAVFCREQQPDTPASELVPPLVARAMRLYGVAVDVDEVPQ